MNEEKIKVSPFSSLLGRLQSKSDVVLTANTSLAQHFTVIKNEIQHDLEVLLNTRFQPVNEKSIYFELQKSIAHYGMPDFSQYVFKNLEHQEKFKQDIIDVIEKFEPRLHDVKIVLQPYEEEKPQQLKMTIEANYYFSSQLIAFSFNSNFDSTTQAVSLYEGHQYG